MSAIYKAAWKVQSVKINSHAEVHSL